MVPISDLQKRFRTSLGHELIGKKIRLSRDSVLEFWSSDVSCSEKDGMFYISVFRK